MRDTVGVAALGDGAIQDSQHDASVAPFRLNSRHHLFLPFTLHPQPYIIHTQSYLRIPFVRCRPGLRRNGCSCPVPFAPSPEAAISYMTVLSSSMNEAASILRRPRKAV